jgi:hypothetical protein
MSTHTTAVNLDSFDDAVNPVTHRSRSRELGAARMRGRLHGVNGMLGAAIVTPFVVLALSALVLVFLFKLLIALVATGFER